MAVSPLLLILFGIVLEYSGFDIWWIKHFYDDQSRSWPFRGHWLFDTVIHDWGRYFNICMAALWLICFVSTFFIAKFKKHKKILVYFLTASLAGPLIVGIGKHSTHIFTPWELEIFSGTLPYIRLFDSVPIGAPIGEAFPAGHASGGYAYFSLYFLLLHIGSPYKKYGFFFGLGLGLIFGIGQQVRGAHFPSHDLFSMVICWYATLIFYYLFYPKRGEGIIHDT
ncbi:MAG: phosphatase PAP2 family protein [Desulfobacula sp.]|nr:phosphatase PAP2 family protein [Desulfobacula sp.]MBT3484034.1 phosphatase PAP2 family protein [Desulfobacula sp.]MBT3805976.1 phosphatase PAP2 family protein [Desulfobacula sp.]MBT4026339.1 phosphatase PAP2 family protein [Desulfobacula sp.]MBT4198116.1 phosphatase PAP2 family protein [Desulfobacula sp.]